jgi:hypothetical protein
VRGGQGWRELLRRPSWSHAREWRADLYAEPQDTDKEKLTEEVRVVLAALHLLLSLAAEADTLSAALLSSAHAKDLLRYGLLQSGAEKLRRAVAWGVHRLCAAGGAEPVLVRAVVGLMVELLGEIPAAGGPCEEFFALLTRELSAPGVLEAPADAPALARTLARLIRERPVAEASEEDHDAALRGLMSSLRALLAFVGDGDPLTAQIKREVGAPEGEGLLDELCHRCLFAKPTTDAAVRVAEGLPLPKCKSPESQEVGLGLVLELTHGCPSNLRHVLAAVEEHHTLGSTAEERDRRRQRALRRRKSNALAAATLRRRQSGTPTNAMFSTQQSLPHHASRSRTGYCGLKNLGCICYMNSMIQQFYMIRGFREGILGFEDAEEDKDESLMYQLQSLFAHLQESHKGYYNPKVRACVLCVLDVCASRFCIGVCASACVCVRCISHQLTWLDTFACLCAQGFCHALKNWEGEPTDPFIQQDAQEFLTLFLQQVRRLDPCQPPRIPHHDATQLVLRYFSR